MKKFKSNHMFKKGKFFLKNLYDVVKVFLIKHW